MGAGFSGLSVAYHLLKASAGVRVTVVDEGGLCGGASAVAGGLLHPLSPRGRPLWRGVEAFEAAKELVAAAEAAAEAAAAGAEGGEWSRRDGVLRPARDGKQARDFEVATERHAPLVGVAEASAAQEAVPGLAAPPGGAALLAPQGMVVDSRRYLQALWRACIALRGAEDGPRLLETRVESLDALTAEGGYDAVVLCAGAAANALPETSGRLPLTPVSGHVIELEPPSGDDGGAYPSGAPSLLGHTYLAWAGQRLCVGATRDYGKQGAAASARSGEADGAAAEAAAEALRSDAEKIWPPSEHWRTARVLHGCRASPPRTPAGAVPLTGSLNTLRPPGGAADGANADWWLLGGMGARGLVYHAWLGRLVAAAVLAGSEACLPAETLTWQEMDARLD